MEIRLQVAVRRYYYYYNHCRIKDPVAKQDGERL